MKKYIPLLLLFLFSSTLCSYALTYTSAGAGPSNWHSATSWLPNGIPTQNDDVIISGGHTINIDNSVTTFGNCRNLTVDGTLTFATTGNLNLFGDFTVNGIQSGFGNITFKAAGGTGTLSGAGSFSGNTRWVFGRNYTISSNVSVARTEKTRINSNITVTNNGNVQVRFSELYSGATWIQGPNSSLAINMEKSFFTGIYQNIGTFNCSAIGNTVTINYFDGDLPNTVSGYYNLILTYGGNKKLQSDLTVHNDLTVNRTGGNINTLNSNGFNINIKHDLIFNTGARFASSTGKTINFNGNTSAQTLNNSTGVVLPLSNLTLDNSNGLTLANGTYSLSESLTLSNGTLNTGGRTFTMLSTASQTARIAEVTGSGSVSGDFVIQRYINARDTTWSILSSPVDQTTMQDWDNELFIYYSTDYYQASALSYDEATASYLPVSTASKTISPMEGFEVFLTSDFSFTSIGNTTLNTIGEPTIGNQSMLLDYTDGTGYEGQNLVGNPFASSIDWADVLAASTNIDTYADVYDYTTGNYASVNPGDEIGSGQGFWVYALSAGATLNIPESAKTTSSNSSLRKMETPNFNLIIASADGAHTYSHKLELLGDMSYSMQKDANDRPYRMSPNKKAPKITSIIDGKEFVRNAFNSDASSVTFPLLVSVGIDGKYTISAQNMEALTGDFTCITLKDNKLNQTINLNEIGAYTFIATTKDATDRFELELSKNGNCRSAMAVNNININDQVLVLPTVNGNSIAFNFNETLNTTVSVTNMLGQSIVEQFNVQANTQTIELGIPEGFSGMYLITVSNEKGFLSKKFVKK